MGFLLDTHTFLWFAAGDRQLPKSSVTLIEDLDLTCCLSIASLWEFTIKVQSGKLLKAPTLSELVNVAQKNNISILPISPEHLEALSTLPFHHRDPFDRLIFAQALSENLTLISRDKIAKSYKVKLLW
ncbi:MAG: type II toxin-antitoxin system VapC family toxin [Crocinitomicaceae bacterium]|nr:type II toxin-antitoxin system VapC family toxin [Crocinitomicaceae bacterium]